MAYIYVLMIQDEKNSHMYTEMKAFLCELAMAFFDEPERMCNADEKHNSIRK